MKIFELTQKQEVEITLTGTSGTANVVINGISYLSTFNSTLSTTASDFVTARAAAILSDQGVVVTNPSGAILRFRSTSGVIDATSIVNATGNLDGTQAATQVAVNIEADVELIANGGNMTIMQFRNLLGDPLNNLLDTSPDGATQGILEVLRKEVKHESDLITYGTDNDLTVVRKETDGSLPSTLRAEV